MLLMEEFLNTEIWALPKKELAPIGTLFQRRAIISKKGDMTVREFARKIGVNERRVKRILCGVTPLGFTTLKGFMDQLGGRKTLWVKEDKKQFGVSLYTDI